MARIAGEMLEKDVTRAEVQANWLAKRKLRDALVKRGFDFLEPQRANR